ncbi:MAG: 3-hydroxyacyl-CoA dehydrogenase NAD-binding domain-containing protein [Flavisolibacter sp.]
MTTICICGAGTMGSGIAQVAAGAGFKTILYDLDEAMVNRASEKIRSDLQKLVDKQKILAEKKDATLKNLLFTSRIEDCTADVVIEAIIEKPEVKIELFNRLANINTDQTIFASNTSSLSISSLAENISTPGRFAGLHFFNPAPVMKLVEVVEGKQTKPEIIQQLVDLTKRLGKIPVVCKDAPGFIVNRVARPFYIESLRLAEEGLADFATIDQLLESRGFKMGPFKLMDLIGNDVNYAVSCSVYAQLGEPERLKPSYIQEQKVERGELGKKSGQGYYTY